MENKKILTIPYSIDFSIGVLKKTLSISSEKIIEEIKKSELLGRGGASFPTGLKWAFVKEAPESKKFIIANAEEGEPGTFKDRFLLRKFPYKLIDGMIIASIATGAENGFVYINDRYKKEREEIEKFLTLYRKKGILGKSILSSGKSFDIKIIESIGRYITGEETSLFNVIEGKRPAPRLKPPYPPEKGLYNKPTLINNVETLSFIPHIIYNGGEWFKKFGTEGSYGTKLISLSGDVKKKGVYEIELGRFKIKEILKKYGGIKKVESLKCILPSATSQFIFPEKFSTRYDYLSLKEIGSSLGTGGIIVYGKDTLLWREVRKLMRFFMDECCGSCIPGRIGTKRVYEILCKIEKTKDEERIKDEIENLFEISTVMNEIARCPLGQSCVNPVLSLIKYYKNGKIKNINKW